MSCGVGLDVKSLVFYLLILLFHKPSSIKWWPFEDNKDNLRLRNRSTRWRESLFILIHWNVHKNWNWISINIEKINYINKKKSHLTEHTKKVLEYCCSLQNSFLCILSLLINLLLGCELYVVNYHQLVWPDTKYGGGHW